MKSRYKAFFSLSLVVFAAVLLQSCVNYEQKTTFSADGSGMMKIHYWTQMNNFSMGSTLGKFEFEEQKILDNYTSPVTDVNNLTIEDNLADSTKHVNFILYFTDLNKLYQAKAFKDVNIVWKKDSDGMTFKYTQLKDTSASNNLTASDYTITYTFDMPGTVVSSNASKTDGNTLTWQYKVSDLKNDLEMRANFALRH